MPVGVSAENQEVHSPRGPKTLRLATRTGVSAVGSWTPNRQFMVTQGSARVEELASIAEPIVQLRQTLLREGVLVPENGLLRLARPHSFRSAAQAAAVFLARSTVGEKEWLPGEGGEHIPRESRDSTEKVGGDAPLVVDNVTPVTVVRRDIYELRTRDSHVFARGYLGEDGICQGE